MNDFSKLIYTLRKEKGLTQVELGDRLGLTDKAISRWENGESFPETAQLVPLSNIFNITVDELLRGKRNNEPDMILPSEIDERVEPTSTQKPMTNFQIAQLLIALGLFMLGIICLVIMSWLDIHIAVSTTILFTLVAAGVFILIVMGMKKQITDNGGSNSILAKGAGYAVMIGFGVCLFILCPIAFFLLKGIISFIILFCLIFGGLAFTIIGGISWEREILPALKIGQEMSEKQQKNSRIADKACGIIMMLATAAYLFLGIVNKIWHPTWIVFVIGGILCAIMETIFKK